MAEQDELNAIQARQREIKDGIIPYIDEIKKLADSMRSLLAKEPFLEEDLDSAFELIDAIQDQYNDIYALLFEIRDTIQ